MGDSQRCLLKRTSEAGLKLIQPKNQEEAIRPAHTYA